MMVVHDVTNMSTSTMSLEKKSDRLQSTITPFQKVLEKEENSVNAAGSSGAVSGAGNVSSVSSGNDTVLTGKVTLKDLFKQASEKYDISYDFLVAVAKAESDFDTNCVSSAGAKGIMQLMPDECREFGVTDPFNEQQNIMASAKLLKAHLKKFNGDFTLAAAAYNAGSGAVKKYGGVPPYTETQNYVKKIARFMSEGVTVPDRTVSVEDAYSGGGGSDGKTDTTANSSVAAGTGVTAGAGSGNGTGTSGVAASGTSVGTSGSAQAAFDTGKAATEKDLEKVLVTVGSGADKVTMTYGAYLKYLELGTTGVG